MNKPNLKSTESITLIIFSCCIIICSSIIFLFTNQNQTFIKEPHYNFSTSSKTRNVNYAKNNLDYTTLNNQYKSSNRKLNIRLKKNTSYGTFFASNKQAKLRILSLREGGTTSLFSMNIASSNRFIPAINDKENTVQQVSFSKNLVENNQFKETMTSLSYNKDFGPMNAMANEPDLPGGPGAPLSDAWELLLFGGLWALWQGRKSIIHKYKCLKIKPFKS